MALKSFLHSDTQAIKDVLDLQEQCEMVRYSLTAAAARSLRIRIVIIIESISSCLHTSPLSSFFQVWHSQASAGVSAERRGIPQKKSLPDTPPAGICSSDVMFDHHDANGWSMAKPLNGGVCHPEGGSCPGLG
jgi:hypothetical protein